MTLYQKVISVVAAIRELIGTKMSRQDVAPAFRADVAYAPGRLVVFDNVLYRCVTAHSGPWDANDFLPTTVDDAMRFSVGLEVERSVDESVSVLAPKRDVAGEFRDDISYAVGDLAYRDGTLYRCVAAHSGAWSSQDFTASDIDSAISSSVSDMAISTASALRGELVPKDDVAAEFSPSTVYQPGQLVYREGVLYRCVTQHPGAAWNPAHFTSSGVSVGASLQDKAAKSEMSITAGTTADKKVITLKQGTSQTVVVEHQPLTGLANAAETEIALAKKPSFPDLHYPMMAPQAWSIVSEDDGSSPPVPLSITYDYASGTYYVWTSSGTLVQGDIEDDDGLVVFDYDGTRYDAELGDSTVLMDHTINLIDSDNFGTGQFTIPAPVAGGARHFFVVLTVPSGTTSVTISRHSTTESFVKSSLQGTHCFPTSGTVLLEFREIESGRIFVWRHGEMDSSSIPGDLTMAACSP